MSARNFIRLRGELAEGRKVFQVAAELGVSRDEALGMLCRWLLWVDANCVGEDTGLTWQQVGELMGHVDFCSALVEIGWVSVEPSCTVRVLEYEKYLSPTAKERQLTAARVAACRARKRAAEAGELPAGLKRPRKAVKKATASKKGGKR